MPIHNCRGETTREQLVRNFDIEPLVHVALMDGNTIESCTGRTLEREYYVFSYTNRNNQNDTGTFVCGISAANDFIDLLAQYNSAIHRLPLFDPFPVLQAGQNNAIRNVNGRGVQQTANWNPIAKELYDAIGMICIMWNLTNVGGALESVLINLTKNPSQIPSDSDIRSIKTIIHNKFNIGNPPQASLSSCFYQFSLNQGVRLPNQIQFPNLTQHFINKVANSHNPYPYFN